MFRSRFGIDPLQPLFSPADPTGAPAPAPAPAPVPEPAPAPAPGNEENKFRRLYEDADKKVKDLEKAEKDRKDAELSETERFKQEALEAKEAAKTARQEALRLRLCKDLPEEAIKFITATDEEGIKAQVEEFQGLMKPSAPAAAPPAGTTTQPAATQQPTTAEKIAAAQKKGDLRGAIHLMRQEQGLVEE